MKKIIGIGLVLILLIVSISFFINNPISSNEDVDISQQSVEFSENGISLSMPGDWVSANSNSNETVLAIADSNSKDSSGFNSINVNIEKKSNSKSLQSEFQSNYNTLARNSDFNILYMGNVSFNGEAAMEADYTSVSNNVSKQHKAIWIKKGSDIYVILCTAPQSEFDDKIGTFDFIINSIKL
ncbi:PsbP-related protein [Methanobrevibacter olleyae]|uniref:Uncharacterized protein n=1 Tax=Methanobrevibacter olleyae TaxID=294671 RepID=A0A126R1U5_METOL|nr:PsbP-related protein [Methanobrevibacter olleyae]AMK15986.1 hypothetical protein YLM1_1429 [Methanobrevibacter olleyae]SFL16900.1 hypothetical protein SAMN02910297_00105 [Methanobrevibacter olleyae]